MNGDVDSALCLTALTNWTLATDGLDESEEGHNLLDALITLENRGDKLAFDVAVLGADGGVIVGFPILAVEGGGRVGLGTTCHGNDWKAISVRADTQVEG